MRSSTISRFSVARTFPAGVFCCLVLATLNVCNAQILNSFSEPYQTVHHSTAEPGRVETVNVALGDRVTTGKLLLSLDTSELEYARQIAQANADARGDIEYAKSELTIKTNRLEKLKSVQSNGFAGMNELEIAQSELASAQARLQAVHDKRDLSFLEVKRIEAQIKKHSVRSRINGVVIDLLHKPGEYIAVNEPQTAVVADLSRLRVKFHLTTLQAKRLKVKQSVEMQLPVEDRNISGFVEYISPVTSASSLTVRVDVIIENEKNEIRSGIPVKLMLD